MCIPLFDKKHAFKFIYIIIIIIIILHFWHLKHISLSQCLRYFQGFFKMFLEVPYKPWTNYNWLQGEKQTLPFKYYFDGRKN